MEKSENIDKIKINITKNVVRALIDELHNNGLINKQRVMENAESLSLPFPLENSKPYSKFDIEKGLDL